MRRKHVHIQNVPHLQQVIGKPDVGKSCQGRAIKVNARESYERIPAADHLCEKEPKHRHSSPHAY